MSGPYRDGASPGRPCPRCGFELVSRSVGSVRLDECPSCEGVFVANDVLPRLLDAGDLGAEVLAVFSPGTPEMLSHGPMYVKCPHCRAMMNRRQFATGARVVVDVCRHHGVWFDPAELRAVVAFAGTGGLARAAALDAARAEKERRANERELAQLTEREHRVNSLSRFRHSGLLRWLLGRFR